MPWLSYRHYGKLQVPISADRPPNDRSRLARETEGMHDEESDDDDQAHSCICTQGRGFTSLVRQACECGSSATFQMKKPLKHQIASLGAELQLGLKLASSWTAWFSAGIECIRMRRYVEVECGKQCCRLL